ncbi:MAG: YARHG domain-containing protein [Chitinophagales bacterium]
MNLKNIIFSFLLICLTFGLSANDSSFYATGSNLIPLQETSIELKKEILSLTRNGKEMEVQVRFEFYNPNASKTLTVGFVTPPAFGDMPSYQSEHPQVSDFKAMVGDKLLTFKVQKLEDTGFKLSESAYEGIDFVYYFDVVFDRGTTVVQQTYTYRGGESVESFVNFDYRLTNAKGWANKAIEDFELNIDFGDDAYFSVPNSFWSNGETADWQIVGIGRMGTKVQETFGTKFRMVKINKGFLQFRARYFKPDYDVFISDWHAHNEVHFWTDTQMDNPFADLENSMITDFYYSSTDLAELSETELRWLRNYLFAKHGYIFKSKDLQSFFEACNWYIPNPSTKAEPSILSEKERELFDAVVEEEGNR